MFHHVTERGVTLLCITDDVSAPPTIIIQCLHWCVYIYSYRISNDQKHFFFLRKLSQSNIMHDQLIIITVDSLLMTLCIKDTIE